MNDPIRSALLRGKDIAKEMKLAKLKSKFRPDKVEQPIVPEAPVKDLEADPADPEADLAGVDEAEPVEGDPAAAMPVEAEPVASAPMSDHDLLKAILKKLE